jgi:hypothetical protein
MIRQFEHLNFDYFLAGAARDELSRVVTGPTDRKM